MTITVNGRERAVEGLSISYDAVVAMVFTAKPVAPVSVVWTAKDGTSGILYPERRLDLSPNLIISAVITGSA